MKKVIALAVAFAAVAVIAGSEANAQNFSFNNGFQFGAGARAAAVGNSGFSFGNPGFGNPGFSFGNRGSGFGNRGFGFGFSQFGTGLQNRQVRPPYFAEFPPVYYSGIVRRPYGISPFAAPAGVVPVELNHAVQVQPKVVGNPYFKRDNAAPVSAMESVKENPASTENKSTKVIDSDEEIGSILNASYDLNDN